MRRAGRIIYNGAVAVSLLLCLGTVGVWVRSYWVSDKLNWENLSPDWYYLDSKTLRYSRGGLQLGSTLCAGLTYTQDAGHLSLTHRPASAYPLYDRSVVPGVRGFGGLGFEIILEAKAATAKNPRIFWVQRTLTLPLYFPTLLFALLPAHYFLRVRRRRRLASRRARGCCVNCGYDLQATPGRCPECGTIPAKGAA